MLNPESVLVIVAAYLLGAFPTAYVMARVVRGVDIRQYGSGNVGISNVAVHVGVGWAVPLVVSDIFVKGVFPVVVASERWLNLGLGVEVAVGLATILGHNWSIFLRFRGGRGMATILGVLVTLNWPLVILYGSVAGFGWLYNRNSALWWGVATLLLPVWSLLLRTPAEITWFCVGFVLIVAAKRAVSNRPVGHSGAKTGRDPDVSFAKMLWNRLVFDRDVSRREDWVYRTPEDRV